jgi:hypothetical protein
VSHDDSLHLDQGFGSLIGDNFLKSIGIGCIISGGEKWKNPRLEISRIKGNVLALVGATHLLTSVVPTEHSKYMHADSCPVQEHLKPNTSIVLIPKNVIDHCIKYKISRQGNSVNEFGLWVNGSYFIKLVKYTIVPPIIK